MTISVKGEYALHALFDLAARDSAVPIKIAEIARRQKIPQKFLELILSGLKQGGFVESRRGADGGYLLARPADNITIGEVLRHVEGTRNGTPGGVKSRNETPFTEMWTKVDRAVSDVIDQTTLAELVLRWKERQGKYIPNWDI
jgi:Rrf2 family transcriptional regulator, cysteine metabolism repressor